jgi:hypothetical protein
MPPEAERLYWRPMSPPANPSRLDPPCVAGTRSVQIIYQTLYTLVRPRFRTKFKVPPPSHTKKSGSCVTTVHHVVSCRYD